MTIAIPANVRSDTTTTNVTPNKIAIEADLSAPQSIAIVAGRKYIMVPKATKPLTSTDTINGKQTTKSS